MSEGPNGVVDFTVNVKILAVLTVIFFKLRLTEVLKINFHSLKKKIKTNFHC